MNQLTHLTVNKYIHEYMDVRRLGRAMSGDFFFGHNIHFIFDSDALCERETADGDRTMLACGGKKTEKKKGEGGRGRERERGVRDER